jgi:hypothetical protein
MTKDEALRLALEAFGEIAWSNETQWQSDRAKVAITAIKAALLSRSDEEAKDEPWEKFCDSNCVWTDHHPDCKLGKDEPAAWMYPDDLKRFETSETFAQAYSIEMVSPTQGETVPLYTTPPQRTWVGLTDEERGECINANFGTGLWFMAKDIEAKLKEKNGYA